MAWLAGGMSGLCKLFRRKCRYNGNTMSFEEERLRILDRLARQELTPQAANLELAMLKQRMGDSAATIGTGQSEPSDTVLDQNPVRGTVVDTALRAGVGCLASIALALLPVTACLVWLWNQTVPVLWPQWPALDYIRTWLLVAALVGVGLIVLFALLFAPLIATFRQLLKR